MSQTVVVFGATGQLGSLVARCLVGNFTVRAATKEPNGAQANELRNAGCQVVQVDAEDPRTLDTVLQAAHGCFVLTHSDFLDPNGYAREVRQGKNIADACAKAGVQHVVYNTQLSVNRIMALPAQHMDAKADIEEYMRHQRNLPLTCIITPIFYQHLLGPPLRPSRVGDYAYELRIPMGQTALDLISAADVPEIIRQVFMNRQLYLHKTVNLSGDKITIKEMASIMSAYLQPRMFLDKQVTLNEFSAQSSPGVADLTNMFKFYCRNDQRTSIDTTRRLNPRLQSFEDWVRNNWKTIGDAMDYAMPQPSDPWA